MRFETVNFNAPSLVPKKERIKNFVEGLRAWTEQRYGRQRKLADAIGVNKSVISNWFAGRQFPPGDQVLAVQDSVEHWTH